MNILFFNDLNKKRGIFLVGSMASGKSSIGFLLSNIIKFKYFDTDIEISKYLNMSINDIFKIHGEKYFRDIEKNIIKNIILNNNNIILSTGGGCIELEDNRKILSENGIIFFLDIDVNTQLKRINNNFNRPLLYGNNYVNILNNIYNKRISLYREISNVIIDVNNINETEVVNKIIYVLNKINFQFKSIIK